MLILADTHVHVYPFYALRAVLQSAFERLGRAGEGLRALFLTERSDCSFFQSLRAGRLAAELAPFTVEPTADAQAVVVKHDSLGALCVFAGRQIVASERLEVLALTTDAAVPDGLPVRDAIKAIGDAGGVPVVPWAPGKWWFQRGRILEGVLSRFSPRELLLGDTSLRPIGWGTPRIMRNAMAAGFKVVAGSDPLPFRGEESRIGRYGISCAAEIDIQRPVTEVRRMLTDPATPIDRLGTRDHLPDVLRRLWKNQRTRSSAP